MASTRAKDGLTSRLSTVAQVLESRFKVEWQATALYGLLLSRPRAAAVVSAARDPRPLDLDVGRRLLEGRLELAGSTLAVPRGGDVWNAPCPSRAFAVALHRFAWLSPLAAQGAAGVKAALKIILDWERAFGRVTPFVWDVETLERRVFNLACALKGLAAAASERETATLADCLSRQARHLLNRPHGPFGDAGGAVAALMAGLVLGGRAGEILEAKGRRRLVHALEAEVFADGGVRSRCPEAALELLFDLLALDDLMVGRGRETPEAVSQAIDRLTLGVRFFQLGDNRLAAFHGGGEASGERIAAALAHEEAHGRPPSFMPYGGFHRLDGPALQVIVDAAPPPEGAYSGAACAQPLALEITAGGDRLVANAGWSPAARGPAAFRLASAGSTASVGDASAGSILTGARAAALGPRLIGGARWVEANRHEEERGVWLELAHDGFQARYGLLHRRRLFLDTTLDEIRGEDRFEPVLGPDAYSRRIPEYAVRFHLPPDVKVSLARDRRSVLLRGPSNRGWWFRNDAPEVLLEASTLFIDRRPCRGTQVVLKGPIPLRDAARVRWKLAPVEPGEVKASAVQATRRPQPAV